MNRSLILLPLFILCTWTAPPPCRTDTPPVTLESCLEKALPYADAIKLAEESLYAAEQDRKRARSVLIPHIGITGSLNGEHTDLTGASFPPDHIREKTFASFVGLGFEYSFYLNGRELIVYRATGELVEKAGMELEAARQDYMLQVAAAFFNCVRREKGLAIATANLKRLDSHRNAVIRRIEAGLLTKTERFRSDSEFAAGEASLTEARNQLAVSRRILRRLVPLQEGFLLVEPDEIPVPAAQSLEDCVALARKSRPELKALHLASRVAAREVEVAKSAYWPKLTLEGTAGRKDSTVAGRYDSDSIDFDQDATLYSASLTLSLPLLDGGLRRADVRKSMSAKRSVDHEMSNVSKEIRLAVERAWYDYITEFERAQALTENLVYSRQFLEAVSRQFDEGLAQSLDLVDANTRLVDAQNNLADTRFAQQLAAVRLRYASGLPLLASRDTDRKGAATAPTPSEK